MRKERIKGRKGWGSKEGKKGGREGKKNLIRDVKEGRGEAILNWACITRRCLVSQKEGT